MKKVLLTAYLIMAVILLSSCKKEVTEAPEVSQNFSTEISMKIDNFEAKGTLERIGKDNFELVLEEPDSLKGLTFNLNNEKIVISYLGLKADLTSGAKLINSTIVAVTDAIKHGENMIDTTLKSKGSDVVICGEIEPGEYELVVNKKTGKIKNINVPDLSLKCKLS